MKKISIGGIICLAIALATFVWSFSIMDSVKKAVSEIKRDVVLLNEPVIKPENEGKPVLITGSVSVNQDELRDGEFDVGIHTLRLERCVYMYQQE